VPLAGWITILWAVVAAVNVGAVTIFGEIEVVMSTIKFSWIFVVIISSIGKTFSCRTQQQDNNNSVVISAGGALQGDPIGFRYWTEMPFTNGFKGFVSVLPTGIFAMSGSENCSYVASECENPRKAVPKAVGSIWLRLGLFYLIGSMMVTITVSPKNADIFGGTGTNASPYVVAFRDAGLPALAHCMNAVIFLSVLSTGTISGYTGSRTTVGLAQLGMAPKVMFIARSRLLNLVSG
jgi:yeast amino acid transporter